MAFDQSTRGRLQKLVNNCRGLLSDEFSIQLQQTYGLDPKTGEVTPMARLTHLDDRQRHTAEVLRQTLAHYLGADADDTEHRIAVLDRMLREQAFTVLNRLAALLMMEARGQLIESVSKGYQSRGYQLYSKIAGTALGETGQAYQVYLFSVFDELAQELPALFDRYAANGLLFPRDTAIRALLDELNHFEIEPLWTADETIGWIYQYFNSKEERKEMREARSPRNSRELAVRNQFFTPRYVVEFLVDNTLGRLWLNATGGQTNLRHQCKYLQIKPDEQPQAAIKLRDPRTLKLLDPACGSMHFGLYAFDLFVEIYKEAWAWEQKHGPGSLCISTKTKTELKPLCQFYEDELAFTRDVPRLIIENNIYGVDIDPRAAQIAKLALWLRAQRAWNDESVKAKDRPVIRKSHVLAAIAPPSEPDLLQNFSDTLDKQDAELFEKTIQLLKGLPELGVLLKIETELPDLIRKIYAIKGTGLFAAQELESWRLAELRLRKALNELAVASKSTFQGRLFAQDVLQGFQIIDLCQEKFDVIVMNPPFGDSSVGVKFYIDENYPNSKGNLLANFIERSKYLLNDGGYLGAIVSRTCFFLKSFSNFRKNILFQNFSLNTFADLGHGVLDAMVETAAATWSKNYQQDDKSVFFRHLTSDSKPNELLDSIKNVAIGKPDQSTFFINQNELLKIDDVPFIYWISPEIINKLLTRPPIDPAACDIRVGLQTNDDFRFLRLWYEVNPESIISPSIQVSNDEIRFDCISQSSNKNWAWYSKTDKSSAFQASIHVLAKWSKNGAEVKAFIESKGHVASKHVMSEDRYFTPGFSYMLRATRLVPYVVPIGVIPTAGRSQIYPRSGLEDWVLLLMGSNIATCVARFRGENFSGPKFQNSMVGSVPYIPPEPQLLSKGLDAISIQRSRVIERLATDDSEIYFRSPSLIINAGLVYETDSVKETLLGHPLEEDIAAAYGINEFELNSITRDLFEALKTKDNSFGDNFEDEPVEENADEIALSYWHSLISYALGCSFGRWDIRKALHNKVSNKKGNPFEPLPSYSPGALNPIEKIAISGGDFLDYPLTFAIKGILAGDSMLRIGLSQKVHNVFNILNITLDGKEKEFFSEVGCNSVEDYLSRPSGFFANHLKHYSKSRRRAPIYWPISTLSGGYTLWLYYPDISTQTLYSAVNDFVDPKIKEVNENFEVFRNKGSARSREDEKQYETLQSYQLELLDLRNTLLKIAPSYHPNHEDGVQITAAPLWQLFRHKPWQKVLKDTWTKLEKGDYDWAHLAMAYWPDRVREKCKTDKSIAIAHGLEDLYVEPEATPKKSRGKKKAGADE